MALPFRPPYRIRTALGLTFVTAIGAAAMGAGAPTGLAVLATSGIGSALLMSDRGKRQPDPSSLPQVVGPAGIEPATKGL